MTVFFLIKVIGVVLVLKGVKGLLAPVIKILKKIFHYKQGMISILINGYYFLTGCFLLTLPNLDIKMHQVFLLGATYFGLSTIFWIFVNRLDSN